MSLLLVTKSQIIAALVADALMHNDIVVCDVDALPKVPLPRIQDLKPFDCVTFKQRKSKGDKARSRKEHRQRYKV